VTVDEWLKIGWDNGWCSPPVCGIHDGIPMSYDEEEEDEPCVTVVRVYGSDETRTAVENDHSPTVWRARALGWHET